MTPSAKRLIYASGMALLLVGCETPVTYEPAAGASAQGEIQAPSFAVGDEFWYSTNRSVYVEVFEGEEDGRLLFRRGGGSETLVFSDQMALVQLRDQAGVRETYDPDDGRLAFPLTLGKTWERTYQVFDTGGGPQVQRTRACQVAERGFATVPAGRFEVFRIDCALSELKVVEVQREQVFYAPEIGRIILRLSERRGYRERLLEFNPAAPN
ncbi:MAG: hypothetical protein AAF495_13700 [Pseudomonadota bacterium]